MFHDTVFTQNTDHIFIFYSKKYTILCYINYITIIVHKTFLLLCASAFH